jgi:phosphoribosylformylglycinamidine synthase
MPHPEAFNHWTNHPDWTCLKEKRRRRGLLTDPGPTSGIRMFQNAVTFMQS